MREKLEKLNGQRIKVQATFKKIGEIVSSYQGRTTKTVLFVDVKDEEGNIIADHIWFKFIQSFKNLDLQEGDIITFTARVCKYQKGYISRIWMPDGTDEEFEYYNYCCKEVGYDEPDFYMPDEYDYEYFENEEYYDFINYFEHNGHYEILDNTEIDYKLIYPTKIKKLKEAK